MRLETHEPATAGRGDLAAHVLAELVEPAPERLLGDPLDPHHRARRAAAQLAHPLPAVPLAGRGVAVVDQKLPGRRRPQEAGRVVVEAGGEAVGMDGRLVRTAAEMLRQFANGTAVGEPRRHVRPLGRIGALREHPPELVKRRTHRQDPVGMVIDRGHGPERLGEPVAHSAAPTNWNAGRVTLSQ